LIKRIKLSIDKIAYGGSGIGRYNDMVVFVPFSAPGDEVSVKIIEEKKNYWLGDIEEIITPSPQRVEPPCPYFMVCGGCQLQHITYDHQLAVKKMLVEDAVNRLGKIAPVILEPLGMTDPWHYRNKTQYPLAYRRGVEIGYYRRQSHRVIDIPSCLIHPPAFDRLAEFLRAGITTSRATIYYEQNQFGNLRHVIIRRGLYSNECLLIIVTKTDRLQAEVYKEIQDEYPELVGVVENINPDNTNRILGSRFATLAGRDCYFETLLDKKFQISAGSFFQVNTLQTEALLKTVIKFLDPARTDEILDLFSGVGAIGITLAPMAGKVSGIEIDRNALRDGRENLKLNGITNMEFFDGAVEKVIQKFSRADAVIVDPPRKGCDAQLLRAIVRLTPKKIIYVSCNPTTLARDLAILAALGYPTLEIQPVDLFPHTYHIEVVAKIERGR
jgi:23S rRNA (uracil1939-C5)-methyltransferase